MSEVQRITVLWPVGPHGYGNYPVVLASEYDKSQSELAALREELATFDEGMREIAFVLGAGGYNAESLSASQLVEKVKWALEHHASVQEQRLTAVERRNTIMTKALERITRPHDCGCVPCTGSCASKYALEIALEEIREIAGAALKPTESGASE